MKHTIMRLLTRASITMAAMVFAATANATLVDISVYTGDGGITGTLDLGPATSGGLSANLVGAFTFTINDQNLSSNGVSTITGTHAIPSNNGDALCMTGSLSIGWCQADGPLPDLSTVFEDAATGNQLKFVGFCLFDCRGSGFYTYNVQTGNTDDTLADMVYPITMLPHTPVPEPNSLALLSIGLVGLGVMRQRKNKKRIE